MGNYDFWMPEYRYQFIKWLRDYLPSEKTQFHRMTLEELRRFYVNVREDIVKKEKLELESKD